MHVKFYLCNSHVLMAVLMVHAAAMYLAQYKRVAIVTVLCIVQISKNVSDI